MQKTGCAMSLTLISVNTVDILYNKEYNYGLVVMDYHTTTNTNHIIKENTYARIYP